VADTWLPPERGCIVAVVLVVLVEPRIHTFARA
jgi:hypothetical protein